MGRVSDKYAKIKIMKELGFVILFLLVANPLLAKHIPAYRQQPSEKFYSSIKTKTAAVKPSAPLKSVATADGRFLWCGKTFCWVYYQKEKFPEGPSVFTTEPITPQVPADQPPPTLAPTPTLPSPNASPITVSSLIDPTIGVPLPGYFQPPAVLGRIETLLQNLPSRQLLIADRLFAPIVSKLYNIAGAMINLSGGEFGSEQDLSFLETKRQISEIDGVVGSILSNSNVSLKIIEIIHTMLWVPMTVKTSDYNLTNKIRSLTLEIFKKLDGLLAQELTPQTTQDLNDLLARANDQLSSPKALASLYDYLNYLMSLSEDLVSLKKTVDSMKIEPLKKEEVTEKKTIVIPPPVAIPSVTQSTTRKASPLVLLRDQSLKPKPVTKSKLGRGYLKRARELIDSFSQPLPRFGR